MYRASPFADATFCSVTIRVHHRLKHARIAAGHPTAVHAARAEGWPESSYRSHENGTRGVPLSKIQIYAKAFKVRWQWLLQGAGSPMLDRGAEDAGIAGAVATLTGAAGAGERIAPFGRDFTGEPIPCPPGFAFPACIVVRGDSMWPVYRDGDLLFYERADGVPKDALTRDCVCQVAPKHPEQDQGEMYVKRLLAGSKAGLYDLQSYNHPDLLRDQRLMWAAPIHWVKRA